MGFRRAMAAADLRPGEMRGVVVDDRKVLLVNVDGTVHAYADRCAHQATALSGGDLADCVLTCPAHAWQYDVRTGEGVNPRAARLVAYPVKTEADSIFVDTAPVRDARVWVGPTLHASPATLAIVTALLEENEDARVVDRGAIVRVVAPRRCVLARAAVERHLKRPFDLRAELAPLLASFEGRLAVADEEATWEAETGP